MRLRTFAASSVVVVVVVEMRCRSLDGLGENIISGHARGGMREIGPILVDPRLFSHWTEYKRYVLCIYTKVTDMTRLVNPLSYDDIVTTLNYFH